MAVMTRTARLGGSRLGRIVGGTGRRGVGFLTAVRAVMVKELRGRMRGRRAFVVLTVYLVLLGIFAFGVYQYVKQNAVNAAFTVGGGVQIDPGFGGVGGFPGFTSGSTQIALSASIGHALFSSLVVLETLLVLVLAPAFTTGAISLEREKQTIELLVTTPLSTIGMVIGKLLSALVYVFLLILASIPFVSIVFPFGGVGPEDMVRAYAMLFALAFGMGAIGMFVSALVRRTQTATVMTFVLVLALTLGSGAVHAFWFASSRSPGTVTPNGQQLQPSKPGDAPEALLWLNPFVSALDLICTTAPGGYDRTCDYLATVTRKPYFGADFSQTNGGACPPDAKCFFPPQPGGVNCANGVCFAPGGVAPVPMPVPAATAMPAGQGVRDGTVFVASGPDGSTMVAFGKAAADGAANLKQFGSSGAASAGSAIAADGTVTAASPPPVNGHDIAAALADDGSAAVAAATPEPSVTPTPAPGTIDPGPGATDSGPGVIDVGPGQIAPGPSQRMPLPVFGVAPVDPIAVDTFGYPRDTFWPHSTVAFLAVGVVLTFASAQLVAPTRRSRLLRRPSFGWRPRRRAAKATAAAAGTVASTAMREPVGGSDVPGEITEAPTMESPA